MKIDCKVNGRPQTIEGDPMRRLLDVLREELGLTGTKEGCGEGECGACTVLLDGKLVNSCLIPIAQAAGSEITTIEEVRESDLGKTISDAFAETHAVQCGFCSPGMVMAAAAYLTGGARPRGLYTPNAAGSGAAGVGPTSGGLAGEGSPAGGPSLSEAEIREAISGNICRCTGYDMIVDGIELAGRRLSGNGGPGAKGGPGAERGAGAEGGPGEKEARL
jgi:aerobic carbon-monoxide dehydrogenase small subunit